MSKIKVAGLPQLFKLQFDTQNGSDVIFCKASCLIFDFSMHSQQQAGIGCQKIYKLLHELFPLMLIICMRFPNSVDTCSIGLTIWPINTTI